MNISPEFLSSSYADRQDYVDAEIDVIRKTCVAFQPKYDGIWALFVAGLSGDSIIVYSRTKQVKAVLPCTPGTFPQGLVLIGEYMFGSQWSKKNDREGLAFIFDCWRTPAGSTKDTYSYEERLILAGSYVDSFNAHNVSSPLRNIPTYPIECLDQWLDQERGNYEGFVGRNLTSLGNVVLARHKFTLTDDFVIMGTYEGRDALVGKLGGITVGKFKNGILHEIMNVGGGFTLAQRTEFWIHRHELLFRVVEIEGRTRFDSGALRHPNFIRFNDEKPASSCVCEP